MLYNAPTTLSTLMAKAMNDRLIQPGEGVLHHAEGIDLIPDETALRELSEGVIEKLKRLTDAEFAELEFPPD